MNTEEDKEEEPLSLTWLVWNERFAYNINTHVYFFELLYPKRRQICNKPITTKGKWKLLNVKWSSKTLSISSENAASGYIYFGILRNTKYKKGKQVGVLFSRKGSAALVGSTYVKKLTNKQTMIARTHKHNKKHQEHTPQHTHTHFLTIYHLISHFDADSSLI